MFLPIQSEPVQRSLTAATARREACRSGVDGGIDRAGVQASEWGVQPSINWDSVLKTFCQSLPLTIGG